jgi:hypothetical protein
MEYEAETYWTGGGKSYIERPLWSHAYANNNLIGGISIGIHPILKKHADPQSNKADKWGRWSSVELIGKKRIIKIIAVYNNPPKNRQQQMQVHTTHVHHKH